MNEHDYVKGNVIRIYLPDHLLQQVKQLSEVMGLRQTEFLTHIVEAGLRAVIKEGRMVLPLVFKTDTDEGWKKMEEVFGHIKKASDCMDKKKPSAKKNS